MTGKIVHQESSNKNFKATDKLEWQNIKMEVSIEVPK